MDTDGDGVLDSQDVCPGTLIPESVPTAAGLNPNHYALLDDEDFIFDTVSRIKAERTNLTTPDADSTFDRFSRIRVEQTIITTTDTAGCSCEQIIDALDLGLGQRKYGCSRGTMREWVELVNP